MIITLLAAVATVAACWCAGRLVCGSLAPAPGAVSFCMGAALLSTLLFFACALGWVTPPVLLALLVLPVALGFREFRAPRLHGWMLWFAPFALWYLVCALAPEASADGNYYHLTYPQKYLQQGGFFPVTYNMYASLPQGLEMLFLPAIAFGGYSAAALVHLAFLFALAAALAHAEPKTGWVAALLVFASPVVGMDASVAYNDIALAGCTFAAYLAAERITAGAPRHALVAGALAGFCFAIKYTGALALPLVLAYTAFRTRSARWTLLALGFALIAAAPWLVRNAAAVGNPVSPFFNRVFPNPHVRVDLEDRYREAMRRYGGHTVNLQTPLELTVRGGQLQGFLGPAFLLAPLAFFGSSKHALLGLYFALPWTQNIGTRFLIPALPFFALGLAALAAKVPWAAVLHAASCLPPVAALYCAPHAWRIEELPWKAALGIESEHDFLARRIGQGYTIARMLNEKTPEGAVIYTALPLPDAYCPRRTILLDYTSAVSNGVRDALPKGLAPAREALRNARAGYLLIHREEPHAEAVRGWGFERTAETGPVTLYKVD